MMIAGAIAFYLIWSAALGGVYLAVRWIRLALARYRRGDASFSQTIGAFVFPVILLAIVAGGIVTHAFPYSIAEIHVGEDP